MFKRLFNKDSEEKRQRSEEVQASAAAAAADVAGPTQPPPPQALVVSHVLDHDVRDVRAIAWDAVRNVLIVAAGETLWVIGHGWMTRRFRMLTEGPILCLKSQLAAPVVVVATPEKLNLVDYETGVVHVCYARPEQYVFTACTALVGEAWVLVARSDGIVQGLDAQGAATALNFNLTTSCPHPERPPTLDPSVTVLLSRMFHKQIVIAFSQRTGLCQYNFVRKELLNRFALPKDAELSQVTMCAMDKYLVAGLKDGRVALWKTQDEPRNKRTHELPPMLIVPALGLEPIHSIECYGSGTEDVLPCRWLSGSKMVEVTLRPKEKMPAAVSMQVVCEEAGSVVCGLTASGYPERTALPTQVVGSDAGSLRLLSTDAIGRAFRTEPLSRLNAVSPIVSAKLLPAHRPELLSVAPRTPAFPWCGGGRSQFAEASSAGFLLGCGGDGRITLLKTILERDAFAPHNLRALDLCNSAGGGDDTLRGSLSTTPHGGAALSCMQGNLTWVDMATLQATPVEFEGNHKAVCAEFIGAPLNRIFIGTSAGKLIVLGDPEGQLEYEVQGASGGEILSVQVVLVGAMWVVHALFVNSVGATEIAVISFDPNAPFDAMSQPEEPLLADPPQHHDPQHDPLQPPPPPPPLPPRPLRGMGLYTVSSGVSSFTPSLHIASTASVHIPQEPSRNMAMQVANTVVFNQGTKAKAAHIPATNTECVIVLRLADDALDAGEITAGLNDLAGHEFVAVTISRVERPGFVKVLVEWLEAPFARGRNVVQLAEADEVPLSIGEDTVLAICVAFDGASIAVFNSVDAGEVPTDRDVAVALQRHAATEVMINGGPMWALNEVLPLLVLNENEVCQRCAVSSVSCSPASSVKALQVFDDITNPDAPPHALLNCIRPEHETAAFVATTSQDHSHLASIVVASTGTVHQAAHRYDPAARKSVTLGLSAPVKVGGAVLAASCVRLYADLVPHTPSLAFVVAGETLHVVPLPVQESGDVTPLVSYTNPGLRGASVEVRQKACGEAFHVVCVGGTHGLLHLVVAPVQDDGAVAAGCTLYDVTESSEKSGPFKHLPQLQPRPSVKAPGMGTLTMKSMYKFHEREVQQVNELVAKIIEETFDDFTSRILPEDQKKKMAEEIAQSRKELFGDEPEHQESQSSQSAEVKQVGNAMSETKDIMNKNVEMLNERGDKIDKMTENTQQLAQESNNFLNSIKEHNKRQAAKKWWQL